MSDTPLPSLKTLPQRVITSPDVGAYCFTMCDRSVSGQGGQGHSANDADVTNGTWARALPDSVRAWAVAEAAAPAHTPTTTLTPLTPSFVFTTVSPPDDTTGGEDVIPEESRMRAQEAHEFLEAIAEAVAHDLMPPCRRRR